MNNIFIIIMQMWEIFLMKGYPTNKCIEVMNGVEFQEAVETGLMDYIRDKRQHGGRSGSIIGHIFELFKVMIIVAFNHSFWDPYMYKTNDDEVTTLRRAFYSESYIIYQELFEYIMKDLPDGDADLTVIRERLTSLLFRRLTTFAYRRVVETELTEYPCNMTTGEKRVRDIEDQFEELYGWVGSDEELSEFAGCRPITIRNNRNSLNTKMTISLDMEVDDSDSEHTLGDCIPDSYRDFQPEKVVDDMLNDEIDGELQKALNDREYRRTRTRIDNDDMPEYEMAREEVGIKGDMKTIRKDKRVMAAQKSINRDLTSARIKLRIVMEPYRDDIL